jgi:cytochrome P450
LQKGSGTKFNEKLNPFPFYSDMRKKLPLVYDERSGSWNAYQYNDVKQVLTNFVDFSSDFTKASIPSSSSSPEAQERPFRRTLITSDPPMHRYLRSTISSAFSASSIEALGPRIKDISNALIDEVIEDGSMDLVRDFSYPLPVTVIAELLGIPVTDRDLFKRWADEVLKSIDEVVSAAKAGKVAGNRMQRLQKEMDEYFRNVIAEKRKTPSQDLITRLIKAEAGGKRLSDEEILSFCALLLQAGHLTTVNLINNCIWSLLENPLQLQKLEKTPASSTMLTSAMEETLRYRSPVQGLARICVRATELSGKAIIPGQRVIAWVGSANHDDAVFSNPEEFNIMRSPNPHIAFGSGIHLCLGAPLARLEGYIALESLLSRLQNLEFGDHTGKLEPISESLFLYGVKSLPLRFRAISSQA